MDPMTEFYIKLGLAVVGAGIVFVIMEVMHRRKLKQAQKTFEWTLKSRGMSLDIEEKKDDSKST